MADFRDELDASLLFGSGYVCVVGPPSSGKTTQVLEYLVARERHFNKRVQRLRTEAERPLFCLEYTSARSASNELLRYWMRRLQPAARFRRLSYECTPLEFGASLVQWLETHAEGSELHLVVDDADMLEGEVEDMNMWLSHTLETGTSTQTRLVVIWLISELPLRLTNCFRFHFVARPEVAEIVRWLQQQYEEERALCLDMDEDEEEEEAHTGEEKRKGEGACTAAAPATVKMVSADEVHRVMLEAFAYYATRQPMSASVVSRDVRLLVQRVYQLLPPLLLDAVAGERKLNARHFAAAWGQYRPDSARGGQPVSAAAAASSPNVDGRLSSSVQDPLVVALKRLGYSAVLLALAAFYGGAVPKRKQHQVFGRMGTNERKAGPHEAKGQSHKAAVLTASAHVLTLRRLAFLYEAMLRMCTPHIDPLEFTTAEVALQYVQGLVTWGLLTPVMAQRHRSYHCWIPVSTAQQLARELSLSLFDLIPA